MGYRMLVATLCAGMAAVPMLQAQTGDVTARLLVESGQGKSASKLPPAVVWLRPLGETRASVPASAGKFTLLQKNKMFSPHLLVVPVGSSVLFPNADPYFHNVFSLFDGRRFDLGLYEAGSTRSVTFAREGISYIFCNIHPEMSAVIISLSTPLYAVADPQGLFRIKDVPEGEYELHVWVEGNRQPTLDRLTRRLRIGHDGANVGEIRAEQPSQEQHLNMFGEPYKPEANPVY